MLSHCVLYAHAHKLDIPGHRYYTPALEQVLFRAKRGLLDPIKVCMASLRVSKASFLVGTRTLALSTGASVSDIRGLQNYSLAGLDSPRWSMFA